MEMNDRGMEMNDQGLVWRDGCGEEEGFLETFGRKAGYRGQR